MIRGENMRNTVPPFLAILMFLLFFAIDDSFAVAKYLKTEEAKADEIAGVFTLILYGRRDSNDIETIVFLDKEGDEYEFEPYAPEFDYRIKRGVSAKEALDEAKRFVSFHNSYWYAQLSRIIDHRGKTIGYELRPRYYPFVFGVSDVLDVNYVIKDSKVVVRIRLRPEFERIPFDGRSLDNTGIR